MTGLHVRSTLSTPFALLLGLMTWLGACAPLGPPIEPVTELGAQSCDLSIDGKDASDLPMTSQNVRAATVDILATAPCWRSEQGPGLYHAFVLPSSAKPLVATISSLPAGRALLAPRVLLLDATGRTTRQIAFDAFQFRGDALSVFIRLHPDDRMLVVTSSPKMVGTSIDLVQERVTDYPGPSGTRIQSGSDAHAKYVWSYTGRVAVTLEDLPDVRTGP